MQTQNFGVTELSETEMQTTDGGLLPALVGLAVLLYATDAW